MNILSSDGSTVKTFLDSIRLPQSSSHKGQNGKVLIIGGSSLFHGAVLWAAEAASALVDMVHVSSTEENNEIIKKIKIMWQGGIVVSQKDIPNYAKEDNVILIGNGMMRDEKIKIHNSSFTEAMEGKQNSKEKTWNEVLEIKKEGEVTREFVHFLISHFPEKQFILDAGALQMMDVDWLPLLHKKAVITPHQKEFQTLFGIDLAGLPLAEREKIVEQTAQKYSCIILLKSIDDIVSNGSKTVCIQGGNAGLTKGGTGDILAGITAGMSATSDAFSSAVVASFLLKKTAEELFQTRGYWYSVKDILSLIPYYFHSLIKSYTEV